MQKVCAWCKEETEPGTGRGVSHGICEPCFAEHFPDELKLLEALRRLDAEQGRPECN